MKNAIILIVFVVVIGSCTGKTGPAGATGLTGPAGSPGSYSIFFQQGISPYYGYDGCADTCINQYVPDANYGGDSNIYAGYNHDIRTLLKFDVSYLKPTNLIIEAAYIILEVTTIYTQGVNIEAYKVTSPWDEGTGIGGITNDGATWISRTATAMWNNPGGDYDITTGGGKVQLPFGSKQICVPVKASIIQEWLNNPESNYGIIIKYEQGRVHYYSRSYSDNMKRPRLAVYYRMPN